VPAGPAAYGVGMPWAGLPQLKAALPRMAVLAGIWAGLTGLLLAAGAVVIHSAAITHFDRHVVVAAVAVALLVWTRRLPVRAFIVAVLAWAGETGGVQIGKHVLARERPPEAIRLVHAHGWSFPSGHAAAACLAFTVLAWCLAALGGHRAVRIAGWLVAGLAIAATAFSRVELGVHWTTDVIASIVFVACWLTAIAVVLGGRLRQPALIGDRAGGAEPLPRHDQTQR